MKILTRIFLLAAICLITTTAFGQMPTAVRNLILQADALQDEEKYPYAIDKYREVLKLDPANERALFQLATVLKTTGKVNEALPILEKLAASPTADVGVFEMLGGIYNDNKEYDKAGAIYLKGADGYPEEQKPQLNLTNFYLQQKKYPEAEARAIAAIKIDPQDSDSQYAYAQAVTAQNKKQKALLAWCSFLVLNPDGDRSTEVFKMLEKLLPINQSSTGEANEQLAWNLEAAFDRIGLEAPQENDTFFRKFYADYFFKLASTNNMPTLARGISITARPANKEWLRTHGTEVNALAMWVNSVPRLFN
jgi:tetratricopeptide (TPR) repeat protein